MDEIVSEFLVESSEGLDQLDQDFVELEKNPGDKALLANIFRCIHTIKGTCGFLGFSKLESVTHVGENLLSRLRDGELSLTPEITSALLAMVDAVRSIMGHIEESEGEGDTDYGPLVERLSALTRGEAAPPAEAEAEDAQADNKPEADSKGDESSDPEAESQPAAPSPAAPAPEKSSEAGEERQSKSLSEGSIRVDVGLLDKLMNLVGELVLARNQVLQYTNTAADNGLNATTQRLNLITTELQESVMKTRMQPIGNVWSKFPRVVRDLSMSFGKKVEVEMEGKETELDKTIIEAIKDPLTHIVRNAVDHGMETPEAREAAGKPAQGTLHLRAFHEGGQVNIEISDDGRGVDAQKVLAKALQRGLVTQEQAARMTERSILNLIFFPGFSTAEKVTNVSGRGVGMDVVRSNIEKIGGTVDIQSQLGRGTTLRIKIPLTLAIVPALIVRTAGDRFALPQVNLLELVRLEGETARKGIEYVRGAPVHRLRGQLLPLVYLNRTLGLPDAPPRAEDEEEEINIVVLQADERVFGLVVDEILDTEEIVVKPLGKQLKTVDAFAGATIMGDGAVALILDVLGLSNRAGLAVVSRRVAEAEAEGMAAAGEEKQTMLLFQAGENRRVAIPLSDVARLEEFDAQIIERAGSTEVVQYRGHIMPLVRLSEVLGRHSLPQEGETLHVVVYKNGAGSVGLIVDKILDIVDEQIAVHRTRGRSGIVGSAVIQEKVTDVLDVKLAIDSSGIDLFEHPAKHTEELRA
ncbi:MAG: chemotaxis protein CheA [Myxococcota bacterium]